MSAGSICPSEVTLAQFIDGRVAAADWARISEHIGGCQRCYDAVTGTAVFLESEPREQTNRLAWWAAAAILVLALAAGVLWRLWQPRDSFRELIAAAERAPSRVYEGRIANLPHAPYLGPERGESTPEVAMLELQGAAGAVLRETATATDVASRHKAGVAYLTVGQLDAAVRTLNTAAADGKDNAAIWNDLAAARLSLAIRNDQPEQLARALAEVDAALKIDPRFPAALFTRARILDSLHLNEAAIDAYKQFLGIEPDSPWANEARARLRALARERTTAWNEVIELLERAVQDEHDVSPIVRRFPQEARTWTEGEFLGRWASAHLQGDPEAERHLNLARAIAQKLPQINGESLLYDAVQRIDTTTGSSRRTLAEAHLAYREGRQLLAQRRTADAIPRLKSAMNQFRRSDSPMRWPAEFYVLVGSYEQEPNLASLQHFERMQAEVPAKYGALHALVLWQEGTISGHGRRVHETIEAYRRAISRFDALGEIENAATVRGHLADAFEYFGAPRDSWAERLRAFHYLSRQPTKSRLQLTLSDLAGHLLQQGRPAEAAAFANLATNFRGGIATNPRTRADALLVRTLAYHELGDERAKASMTEARRAVAEIADPTLRQAAEDDLKFVDARLRERDQPGQVTAMLRDVPAAQTGRRFFVPAEILLARSRSHVRTGELHQALADLTRAAAFIAANADVRRETPIPLERQIFDELLSALAEQQDLENVFAVADLANTFFFCERLGRKDDPPEPASARDFQRLLAPDAVVLEYVALPDELLIVALTREQLRLYRVPVAAPDLQTMLEQWTAALTSGQENAELGMRLENVFVAPARELLDGRRILIAALDGRLGPVALSAMRYNGSFLVESFEIVTAPSVQWLFTPNRESSPSRERPLIVADPNLGEELANHMPLPEADEEARLLRGLYPGATILTNHHATLRSVTAELRDATTVHLATHAVANATDPRYSFLLLAGEKKEIGRLYAYEISTMDLSNLSLVVLAGCKTATSESSTFPSLASAFVAAGARNSVGALWNTRDRATREFSLLLHRGLLEGRSVSSAVRDSQLAMLNSADPSLRDPGAWGAFQLVAGVNETSNRSSYAGIDRSLHRPHVSRRGGWRPSRGPH